ncbi:fumarate reductase cytochrome b subunit [Sulfurospirillum arcachonense]|uniref:fumarate reductase cytochrome b subunit n=1 Tax=Sulfurospirillum arcachonense TaxID=57666 RepID=UPI0004694B65|nr:fumarate reductase cytochrome b subunit [Sulfurospirillum arcachonense]
MSDLIEGFLGKSVEGKKSRLPAKLDFVQSATGLFLGLFMWGHMFFVSTILVSNDLMYNVTKMFEGGFFFEERQHWIDAVLIIFVLVVFFTHAGLGMRKFPINFRQWQVYKTHMKMMKHDETSMWYVQAITGFVMFFLGSAHLFIILLHVADIGPYLSGSRIYSLWPFYILLLLAVEFHGGIGLYRLCIKWGWFEGNNAKETRAKLKKVKWVITAFFLTLGILTFVAYFKIGLEQKDNAGERYQPSAMIKVIDNIKVGS